ncbi:hypothetical protein FOMPIDRAFT_1058085 [Fomitopsis schrenkii]|uniref:Uncharacterized protein n=1 Tax=Fomitopsis schrenkii TaxID=2126942 RepID=S8G1U4_FOMSC|nr:hypothetical protein FOMPIDRAFT_1058085 [Fomitopsis schrenkii]
MPTHLWRRRTSTPLFPGAWPNSSTSDHSDDQRLPVYSDDAPPQLPELRHLGSRKANLNHDGQVDEDPAALAEEGWGFPIVSEQHGFEDNGRVVGARDRARHGSQPASMSSPASTDAPLSASLSQGSTFSDPTDSEGVLTPESAQGPLWLSPHTGTSITESIKDNPFSSSGSLYHSFEDHVRHEHDSFLHDATIDTINLNTTISSVNTTDLCPRRSAARAAYRNPPLLDFTEPLPHSRISLDWEAVTSSPKTKDALSQNPSLPKSPIEFSVPSTVASPALGEAAASVFNSEAMATTFFPVPSTSSDEQFSDGQQAQPLSSASAYSLGTDSPVLPTEVDPTQNAKPPTHSPYTLMAADLDAFAAAAASTGSSLSLPTSLHSAASEALLAEAQVSDKSPVWPGLLRSFSNESARPSPSLVVAACRSNTTEFPTTPGVQDCEEYDEAGDAAVEEAIRMRARRMSAPLLHSPHTPKHRSAQRERTQTLSGRVDVQRAEDHIADSAARPGKLPVLGKMRKLGGRLLSLFGGKIAKPSSPAEDPNVPAEFAVRKTRRTAVTKVEFESRHPIPAPETPARDVRASRRSLPLRMSKSPSCTPQSPRCESFLPIEDPESASKGILSIPLQHMRGSPSIQLKKDREPSTNSHASPTRASRARTLTAPAKPLPSKTSEKASNGKQARRFSLSSALSKSHLDVLKAAVVPHPPLPDFPQSPTCDQHPHRDEAVRPVRMIPPTGLDAKSSQSSLRGAVGSSKKGKERARPVSMFVHSSSSRRPFLDHPQIQVHAPTPVIGAAPSTAEEKRARHASMLVGKEKDARRSMMEVSGSYFRMHHPSQSADRSENGAAGESDGNAEPRLAVSSQQVVDDASTDVSHSVLVRERVPIERPAQSAVLHADSAQAGGPQAPTRRFSLSSAISQRAIRARSMIVSVGRRSGESDRDLDRAANDSGSTDATATPPTTSPGTASLRPTHRRGRGGTFSTIIDAGVHFDMLTPGFGFAIPSPTSSPPRAASGSPAESRRMSTDRDFPRDRTDIPRQGSLDTVDTASIQEVIGMEEYPSPDSDLDSMSFAGTATLMESMASSMISMDSSYADLFVDAREQPTGSSISLGTPQDLTLRGEGISSGLGEPFEGAEPVIKRVELARALSSAIGSSGSSEGGTPMLDTIEREEERGFLRALGLEVSMEQSNTLRGGRSASS